MLETYHDINYFIGDFVTYSGLRVLAFYAVFPILFIVLIVGLIKPDQAKDKIICSICCLALAASLVHGNWYWNRAVTPLEFEIINTTMYRLQCEIEWESHPGDYDVYTSKIISLAPGTSTSHQVESRAYDPYTARIRAVSDDEQLMLWINSYSNSLAGQGQGFTSSRDKADSVIEDGKAQLPKLPWSWPESVYEDGEFSRHFVIEAATPLSILQGPFSSIDQAKATANLASSLSSSARRQMDYENEWSYKKHFPYNLGVRLADDNSNFALGVVVKSVFSGIPGGHANPLRQGDKIISINRRSVFAPEDIAMELIGHATSQYRGVEDPVNLRIRRDGEYYDVSTTYWFNRQYFEEQGLHTTDAGATFWGAYNRVLQGRAPDVNAYIGFSADVLADNLQRLSDWLSDSYTPYRRRASVSERRWANIQGVAMYQQWHSDAYRAGEHAAEIFNVRKRILRKAVGERKARTLIVEVVDRAIEYVQRDDTYTASYFGIQSSNYSDSIDTPQVANAEHSIESIELALAPSAFREALITNKSPRVIDFNVLARGTDSRNRYYRMRLKPGEQSTLIDASGQPIFLYGDTAYWWADSTDGSLTWRGDYPCFIDGNRYGAHKFRIAGSYFSANPHAD